MSKYQSLQELNKVYNSRLPSLERNLQEYKEHAMNFISSNCQNGCTCKHDTKFFQCLH